MAFRRREEPTTVEDERDALRAQRSALEDLKRELAERVRAVQERDLELRHALAEAGGARPGGPVIPAPAAARTRDDDAEAAGRTRALAEREQVIAARERDLDRRAEELAALPPADPDAARLAQIESRLTELREAEKLFLRTRDELAERSEAVASRERLVAQRERDLDGHEDGKGQWSGSELSEMEARLRRLEEQQPGEQTVGFAGGLRKLEQGTRTPRDG